MGERLGVVKIETNRPDFDRLVNIWLPYQLYASRLFGRIGPNQRGGAWGFRDQLQDVLPLMLLEPRLRGRKSCCMRASSSSKATCSSGGTRRPAAARGSASAPRPATRTCGCPTRWRAMCARPATAACSTSSSPFLEGPSVPQRDDTLVFAPRASRESADVYQHAKLAIEYTLKHMGANGLPLLRAGDWNDGIDGLGRNEIGTGVWMGFFLYNVLDGFVALARLKGDESFGGRCEAEQQKLSAALEVGWFGDHYGLDFADNGVAVTEPNAMTTGWAAHSGAAPYERAVAAIEGGLKGIEKADRVLLLEKPFFEHSQPYPGRIADYPPGVRENGGQYSHGATWIVDGIARLARLAREKGDDAAAARLFARGFEIYEKISPLKKTEPDTLPHYGLIPIQQPADIYDGYGHGGRGGWSWYTGSAARMLSAAYALIGIDKTLGEVRSPTTHSRRRGDCRWKR